MRSILLTNDDGYESPLFREFAEALSQKDWCNELRIACPKSEKSWISQAFTRFDEVHAKPHKFNNVDGFVLDGTPADCVSIGADHLWQEKPDYIFSGINFGENSGRAFFFSSGTIGATIAGMSNQIRSISFSAFVPEEVFECWRVKKNLEKYNSEFRQLAETSCFIAEKLVDHKIWDHCDLMSVNIPWGATAKTERVLTNIQTTYLEKLFRLNDNGNYWHKFNTLLTEDMLDDQLPGDHDTIRRGAIAIAPIKVDFRTDIPEDIRISLEE